jgi:hypothetical protein
MNRDDIIRMAREAGYGDILSMLHSNALERFANLVAAAEREKRQWEDLHTCHPHCDRPACVAVRRAREDEREACARLCEHNAAFGNSDERHASRACALLIRERGAP